MMELRKFEFENGARLEVPDDKDLAFVFSTGSYEKPGAGLLVGPLSAVAQLLFKMIKELMQALCEHDRIVFIKELSDTIAECAAHTPGVEVIIVKRDKP